MVSGRRIGLAYDNLHLRNYTAIIGPACSEVCKMVARLASYLNVPCFSSVCQDIEMQDKSHFQVGILSDAYKSVKHGLSSLLKVLT